MRVLGIFTCFICLFAIGFAPAQTGTLKIGDPAPTFKNLPGTDGKTYSSDDFKQDVLVLVITGNTCPVAMAYEEKLINFTRKYATGDNAKVAFVAISVNKREEDRLEAMKVRAKEKGFNFPYLYDESQAVAKKLNAHVTPEFYVFNKERKLVYWGAMDDDMFEDKVKERYLEPAVESLLSGKTVPTAQTKAFGCTIEYAK